MYLTIEVGALQLRELIAQVGVLVVGGRRDRDTVSRCDCRQLVVCLGVVVDHHLGKLFHVRIDRAFRRDPAELDFGGAVNGHVLHEILVAVAHVVATGVPTAPPAGGLVALTSFCYWSTQRPRQPPAR